MNTRTNKHRSNGKITRKTKLITICLSIMIVFIYLLLLDDKTVVVDKEAQIMLEKAYSDEGYSFPIPEKRYQEILHMMTHQKVRSKLKYGVVEMSEENIEAMMKILKQNKDVYKNSKLYREILVRWKTNIFDEVVKEHNVLNDLLEKKDKKALIKMDKLSENRFIDRNFKSTD